MTDQVTGAAEQPAASILDSLNAAFAEHETPAETPAASEGEPAETPAPADGRARDEKGRFAKQATEGEVAPETAKPAGEEETAAETTAATVAEAPQHWSAEDKALIAKLPAEHRAEVVDRFKKMEAGFTPKLQRAAELEKSWGDVDKFFDPHKAAIQQSGWSIPSLVKAWADMEVRLQKDPTAAIQDIAKFYKVDLTKFGVAQPGTQTAAEQQAEPASVDPQVKALQDELAAIKGTLTGFTEAQKREQERSQLAQQQRTLTEIQSFADAKGEDGQPSHPHFQDVMADILALAQAERAAGRTPVLKDLYDRAVWANPETRAKQLAATQEAEQKKAAAAAKAKAAAAAKAGSSVSGSPTGGAQTPKSGSRGSIRDDIAAAFEQAS